MANALSRPSRWTPPHFGGATPGSVYKLDRGIGVGVVTSPGVDPQALSATAVIAVNSPDRESDLIFPGGGDFANYAKNPVVLWNHSSWDAPIAKCETPDGRLALVATEDRIEATSYFSTATPASYQTFCLIAEGILRGASIHVMPNYDAVVERLIDGRVVCVFPEWEMLEWSWVTLGCHPDAVRKLLDRGRIGEDELLPSLAKSLRQYLPTQPHTANVSLAKNDSLPTEESEPEDDSGRRDAYPTKDACPTTEADEPTELEQPRTDLADESTDSGESPAAEILAALHATVADSLAALRALDPAEHLDIQAFVAATIEDLEQQLANFADPRESAKSKSLPIDANPTDAAIEAGLGAIRSGLWKVQATLDAIDA